MLQLLETMNDGLVVSSCIIEHKKFYLAIEKGVLEIENARYESAAR